MAALILQMKDLQPGAFPHLRYITNTAAALPPAHISALQELFPAYAALLDVRPDRVQALHLSAAGAAGERARARSASPSRAPKPMSSTMTGNALPSGEVGELVIRGPHVMKGYWENPEATDRALRPGPYPWEKVLYTGDLFRTDEEGFLYFVGRKDDIIKTRGEKVSPKEVENVLYALPGVPRGRGGRRAGSDPRRWRSRPSSRSTRCRH